MSRIALSLLALLAAAGCSGRDTAGPTSPATQSSASTERNVVASPSLASASFPRSGALHMTKECSAYTGQPGSYCTITSSDLEQIDAGSKVVYAGGVVGGKLDSDLYLDPPGPGNNIAFGHVVLDLTISPAKGLVTFSGGTGKFTHFQATIAVTLLNGGPDWNWDGPYSFGPQD